MNLGSDDSMDWWVDDNASIQKHEFGSRMVFNFFVNGMKDRPDKRHAPNQSIHASQSYTIHMKPSIKAFADEQQLFADGLPAHLPSICVSVCTTSFLVHTNSNKLLCSASAN
jgi:hypothetical protein